MNETGIDKLSTNRENVKIVCVRARVSSICLMIHSTNQHHLGDMSHNTRHKQKQHYYRWVKWERNDKIERTREEKK